TVGFGCAAGRDRTGVVTALLHSLLGAADEAVADAYLRDAPAPARLRPQLRAVFGLAGDQPLPPAAEVLLSPRREWILDTLDHVRAGHGSVGAYLVAQGLDRDAVGRLAEHLLQPHELHDRRTDRIVDVHPDVDAGQAQRPVAIVGRTAEDQRGDLDLRRVAARPLGALGHVGGDVLGQEARGVQIAEHPIGD